MTWKQLIELEPRLLSLYNRALEARAAGCDALDVWIPCRRDGMKDEMKALVGWRRKKDRPELGTDEAYDIAYDKLYYEALLGQPVEEQAAE